MKKIGYIFGILGVGMFLIAFLLLNNTFKLNWISEYGNSFSFSKLIIYKNTNLVRESFTGYDNNDNLSFYYNIPSDMVLKKMDDVSISYSNDYLTFNYNYLDRKTIDEYKNDLINLYSNYVNINLLRLDNEIEKEENENKPDVLLLKVGYNDSYFETLLILINENDSYHALKYSTVNTTFSDKFISKLIENVKEDNVKGEKCSNGKCNVSIGFNKNNEIEFNNLSGFEEVKTSENNILSLDKNGINTKIHLYFNSEENLFNMFMNDYEEEGIKKTNINVKKYNAYKYILEDKITYLVEIDNNTLLKIDVNSLNDNEIEIVNLLNKMIVK